MASLQLSEPGVGRAAVELDAVSKIYGSGAAAVTALDACSVGFAERMFTAVMGPSGSGKTTLLQCASGIDRPTSGRVRIGGVELDCLGEKGLAVLRRRRVGFVFQQLNLVEALTAEQNVALPLRLDGRRPKRGVAQAALERMGLGEHASHRPAELSGGQQQRVAIARALVIEPDVVFADEPTGALDRAAGRVVLEALRRVVDELGGTIVMVTHDPSAAAYADSVLFLADGRLSGSIEQPTAAQIAARLAELER